MYCQIDSSRVKCTDTTHLIIVITLRDYQVTAKNKILEWQKLPGSNTLVSTMGSGKTIVSCSAIDTLVSQLGKRVWVLVNREELIDQWKNELAVAAPSLQTYHRDIGVIQGSAPKMYHRPIQLVMVQTLAQRLKDIADKFKPDVVLFDEAHETAFQRISDKLLTKWPNIKQINLTATPVRHGKSPEQYRDRFPVESWYTIKTAREMIHEGLWKKPIWKSASEKLADATTLRFSGMKEVGGDFDDTSQAKVMIDLLPNHIQEWKELGGDKHHCVWFTVNIDHANQTAAALKAIGRRVAVITGETKKEDRKKAITNFRKGELDDLVNCQCLTTGFDAPIASCAVWLRRTLSVGLFNQMAGRVLRKFDGVTEALMLDLAGNLAIHPFPEDMDWDEFDPCMRLFRDPKIVRCQNCNHRHDALPVPIHPVDKRIGWLTGQACFKDGRELNLTTIISCHECREPVYADVETLTKYGEWLKECGKAKATGRKPPKYDCLSAGVSIGVKTETKVTPVTINLLYELGIWRLTEGGEKPEKEIKDRSAEYRELRIKLAKNFDQKERCDLRFALLNKRQQDFLSGACVARIKKIANHADRYRAALGYAYIKDRSPVSAYPYWGDNGIIPRVEIERALRSIWAGNPDTYTMLEQWIEYHIENTADHAKKGTCKNFLKILNTLTMEERESA